MKSKIDKRTGWFIAIVVLLSVVLFSSIIALFVSINERQVFGTNLEYVYQKSFYNLVDNVNNTENKMSKLMASSSAEYQKKILAGIVQNAISAENNLSVLPVSNPEVSKSAKFINQLYGYCSSLQNKVEGNQKLSDKEKIKLSELYDAIFDIKLSLNEMQTKMQNGYSIVGFSKLDASGNSQFGDDLSTIKKNDVEYPSMIYDGPFADSLLNKEIKGLDFPVVAKEEAERKLLMWFSNSSSIKFVGETKGKFETYDFEIKNGAKTLFAQVTKKGGKLLTISSMNDSTEKNFGLILAEETAKKFVHNCCDNTLKMVWSDKVGGDAYVNFAPVFKNAIIYADLVKVKIDLATGIVGGYEASAYYINHEDRTLETPSFDAVQARKSIDSVFVVLTEKLCLAPLDYGREVLCYEFKCEKGDDIYYFYINAISGVEENILKVISTDNGKLLM
ncbi:MAG: germination protein YpeB [Clostridia bacterium]